jgi:hypothetical protein
MRTLESQSPILEHTLQFNDLYSFVDKLLSGKLSAS